MRRWLTFKVMNKYYRFKVLPFGLVIAPWICHKFIEAILKWIRRYTKSTAAHIDDIIVGMKDPVKLKSVTTRLVSKLIRACWLPNMEKSVLEPAKTVTFLNGECDQKGVQRAAENSAKVLQLIDEISGPNQTSAKRIQVINGSLNYYLKYAGNAHPLVNAYTGEELGLKPILQWLSTVDVIPFSTTSALHTQMLLKQS